MDLTSIKGKRAFIYNRISDDREGLALGVERQNDDNHSTAERLSVIVAKVFTDNDISASPGSKKYRAEYHEMMRLLRQGEADLVIAYTTSRLTRDPLENEEQIKLAREKGIFYFYTAGNALDLQVSANRKMARIQNAIDAGEVEDIQERITREKLQVALAGKWNGGQRAYGYGLVVGPNPITGKDIRDYHQVVPEEVAVLHECRDRILAGQSQMVIVKDLNRRRIPTAKGFAWTVGKLRRTLLNRTYIIFDAEDPEKRGTRSHNDAEYRAQYPGIFTRADHDMLVALFKQNASTWGGVKSRRYLLSGVTFCGLCGGVMYGQGKTDNGRYIRRYHCKKYNNRGEQVGCCKVFRIAEPVEHLISEAVLFRFDSPQVDEALAPAEDKERVHGLTERLVGLQARREALVKKQAVDPYDEQDFALMLGTIKTEIAGLQSQLASLHTAQAKQLLLPERGRLRDVWDTASLEWRASVIKLLVKRVVIHPGRPGGGLYEGRWRFDPELVKVEWAE